MRINTRLAVGRDAVGVTPGRITNRCWGVAVSRALQGQVARHPPVRRPRLPGTTHGMILLGPEVRGKLHC